MLVSTGGLQSNHTRHVAAAAAKCGLKVNNHNPDLTFVTE